MDIAQSSEVIRAGERRMFVTLLEPVLPGAYRLAFGMLRSEADAEDAVQESVLSAWRHFRHFRTGSDLRPWLLKIVANQCRGQLRNRWNGVVKAPVIATDATAAALEAEDLDLRRALSSLPYEQRLVLVLRYYLDLPFEEVGRTLGVSTKAAKSRTHRALERLRLMPEVYSD
jgi:RNA polymerase sigma-70 factor (ECF subfamily)